MSFFRAILFFTLFLVSSSLYSHNPEDFVIAEIERGQMNFENEQIAAEYGAALKRQRARRLAAMPFYKKFYIFVKARRYRPCPECGPQPVRVRTALAPPFSHLSPQTGLVCR